MRINLTKKDIINSIYMQIGFPKKVSENLFDDILDEILKNLGLKTQLQILELLLIKIKK